MQTWETIARALAPDGTELVLVRRGTEWVVRAAGRALMSSRTHGSEETLAAYALERVKTPDAVLVGGLGLGFTLRAALDRLPQGAKVTVAELIPELAAWNRTYLARLALSPLDDARSKLHVGDVYDCITRSAAALDLILLDVDNGPSALAHARNNRLYSEQGVRACWSALRVGGVLALWSAGPDQRYVSRLERVGFRVEVKSVAAREGTGARDTLFLATKAAARPRPRPVESPPRPPRGSRQKPGPRGRPRTVKP